MIFKDREDAANQLATLLQLRLKSTPPSKIVVASLLRGGVPVGAVVANHLKCGHIALPVAKVGAPNNKELALGALCFDITYLEKNTIDQFLGMKRSEIVSQIELARKKFYSYVENFQIDELKTKVLIAGQNVIIVDDGIATGATVKAAALFVSMHRPHSIIIASPVVLGGFQAPRIELLTLNIARSAHSISQFYRFFPQVGDEEVKKYFPQPTK